MVEEKMEWSRINRITFPFALVVLVASAIFISLIDELRKEGVWQQSFLSGRCL